MIIGAYEGDGEVSRRLLKALPALIVLRAETWESPLVPLLAAEVPKDAPVRRRSSTACSICC